MDGAVNAGGTLRGLGCFNDSLGWRSNDSFGQSRKLPSALGAIVARDQAEH
jgi:hypothetical protein